MADYPYLTQSKRGIWRYRRAVPAHLRSYLGKREVLYSCNTSMLEERCLNTISSPQIPSSG